ncbi:MAG: DUF368 domain-containing protein [Marinobacter sp.]|uniref:DUF368 domain-containing protein n=1 Tax=Marinobacter sp. TaxID=50741 RepID=UPI00299E7EDB|nr:DUF368 domain-containing protein [Marinobacter sp.]MDX1757437.1 DUF368 domain-containing protein [Marinobacter sp.]
MGAADIVPGVSGGTIAFITGIYFRLLTAIGEVPGACYRELLKGQFRRFWERCDGTFLVTLLTGIVASIATLASAISYLLMVYPILLWSFFFGLIVASVWHVVRQVQRPNWTLLGPLSMGIAFAWWVTTLPAGEASPTGLVFFGAGALAICAMILPGISGSFILVILGMYAPVLAAIKGAELLTLGLFAAGCLIGLLSIARVLTWAIHKFHDVVLALLTGFMIGALNKVWPWKETLSWRTNSAGEQVPLTEASVSPIYYAELSGEPSQWPLALVCAVIGFALVLAIEWLGSSQTFLRRPQQS